MAAFIPGASPPLVKTAIRFIFASCKEYRKIPKNNDQFEHAGEYACVNGSLNGNF
jgi:hypothetical protein